MALKCGPNSKTREPTGDGFDPDPIVALLAALFDFLTSLVRVTRRLDTFSQQKCPTGCRPKDVAKPDTLKDEVFDLTWQARQKRWHVRIGVKITRSVTCPRAAATPKPKKTIVVRRGRRRYSRAR